MSMPFYVAPEQVMKDRADYARKGIARGRSAAAILYAEGILIAAENTSGTLHKVSEIYDRIAFAGVGKFSEFDRLRKMGIQWADVEGYRFSRDDVRGKALANVYSQVLGEEFTRSIKPFEVEIVVAEVGDENLAGHEKNALYKIGFDGTIQDQEGFIVIGGSVDNLQSHMTAQYRPGLSLAGALKLGREALQRAENGNPDLGTRHLEVALLDRARPGRKFRRLTAGDIQQLLA